METYPKFYQLGDTLKFPFLPYKIRFYRLLHENAYVFLLQFMGLMLSMLNPSILLIWLSSGTASAFIFLRGMSILPGIGLGSFVAYLMAKLSLGIAFESAILITLQAQLLFWFTHRFIGPTLIFYQIKYFIKFLLLSFGLTALISYLLLLVYSSSVYSPISFKITWVKWWLENFNGILILGFALVTWDTYFTQAYYLKKLPKSLLFSYILSFMVLSILFLITRDLYIFSSLNFLMLVFIILVSLKHGWCGSVITSCSIFLIMSFSNFQPHFVSSIWLTIDGLVGFGVAVMQWDKFFE